MRTASELAAHILLTLENGGIQVSSGHDKHHFVTEALTAFRNEAIEEAACVAEKCNPNPNGEYDHDHQLCGQIALEIRALKKE